MSVWAYFAEPLNLLYFLDALLICWYFLVRQHCFLSCRHESSHRFSEKGYYRRLIYYQLLFRGISLLLQGFPATPSNGGTQKRLWRFSRLHVIRLLEEAHKNKGKNRRKLTPNVTLLFLNVSHCFGCALHFVLPCNPILRVSPSRKGPLPRFIHGCWPLYLPFRSKSTMSTPCHASVELGMQASNLALNFELPSI